MVTQSAFGAYDMVQQTEQSPSEDTGLPLVSIVIPVYNGAGTIQLCLDALFQLDYPPDRVEIIVVDNNSTDGTPDIVSRYPVRLLYEREIQGPHAATNTGIRQAAGEIIAFTDSDCIAASGWLKALVAPFAEDNVVATGGKIEAYQPRSRVERFLQEIDMFRNGVRMADSFPVSLITGNAAYRSDAVRKVGLFNPYMYTGSEVDLSWRVQWATKKNVVYVPEAVVYHKFSASPRRLFRHFRIYGYSEIMLGTLHKNAGYPRGQSEQLRIMLRQVRALTTYAFSFAYHVIGGTLRKRDLDYVLKPVLWMIAESGSLCGKVEALWRTRFYRRQFWLEDHRPL